jgi:predicted DCC family thiol-disulfide oxidoreductase YuxK
MKSVQELIEKASIVLYDGTCGFCNRSVLFIIHRDHNARFCFASLQSDIAEQLIISIGHKPEELPDSLILIENGNLYVESTAALRICRQLDGIWKLLSLFLLVPASFRDVLYRFVARHRYKIKGREAACSVPTPEIRKRFLS